jgi:hypothetical protein
MKKLASSLNILFQSYDGLNKVAEYSMIFVGIATSIMVNQFSSSENIYFSLMTALFTYLTVQNILNVINNCKRAVSTTKNSKKDEIERLSQDNQNRDIRITMTGDEIEYEAEKIVLGKNNLAISSILKSIGWSIVFLILTAFTANIQYEKKINNYLDSIYKSCFQISDSTKQKRIQ